MTSGDPGRVAKSIDVESHYTAMLTCPYYQGIEGGRCVSGCREEPACQVDTPAEGWRPRNRRGQFIAASAEQVQATARARLDEHRRRTGTS